MDSNDEQLAETKTQGEEWSTNSTESVKLYLSGGRGGASLTSEPAIICPVFGDCFLLDESKTQSDEWSTNSTECVRLHLSGGDGGGGHASLKFEATYTYPIFSEEEAIFGYKNLCIDIAFAAHNLLP